LILSRTFLQRREIRFAKDSFSPGMKTTERPSITVRALSALIFISPELSGLALFKASCVNYKLIRVTDSRNDTRKFRFR